MSVYLIHSLPLKMSAIQIFVGDKMACVSHLVGEDTIGWEKELELDGEVRKYTFTPIHFIKALVLIMDFNQLKTNEMHLTSLHIHHGVQC